MNPPQRQRNNRRRAPQSKRPAAIDIWRAAPPLPAVEPIAPASDVGALLRSLGDPPMQKGAAAGHYFVAVVERAAMIAAALAFSVDLLAEPDDD